jgi:hypothetical protein
MYIYLFLVLVSHVKGETQAEVVEKNVMMSIFVPKRLR